MRVKIRRELDVEASVNLRKLKPLGKIQAGFLTMWHNTDFYKTGLNRRLEEDNIRLMQRDEKLKDLLLAQIYKELIRNTSMSGKDEVCKSVVISVDASYKYSLKRVLKHKDFLPYSIELVPENTDVRKAFKDMPFLIRVSKKVVRG
jgi:hypothetical protein